MSERNKDMPSGEEIERQMHKKAAEHARVGRNFVTDMSIVSTAPDDWFNGGFFMESREAMLDSIKKRYAKSILNTQEAEKK